MSGSVDPKDQALIKLFQKTYTSYEHIEDAGQPFVVDVDSILLDALVSPGLDWSYGAQLLQLLYQCELRLRRLSQAGRQYTVVVFDALRGLWRRPSHVLGREILIQHISKSLEKKIPVSRFSSWESPEFKAFLSRSHPPFALISPGGGSLARLLAPGASLLLRRLTMHLIAGGVRVVRTSQICVADTRMEGFHQCIRDSTITEYQALLPLNPIPGPNYFGVLKDVGLSKSKKVKGKDKLGEAVTKVLGPQVAQGLVLAVASLAEYWTSRPGSNGDAKVRLQHSALGEAEGEAEKKWEEQGGLENGAAMEGGFLPEDDSDDDEWDGKGLGAEEVPATAEKDEDAKGNEDGEENPIDEEEEEAAWQRQQQGEDFVDDAGGDDDDDALDNWEDFSDGEGDGAEGGEGEGGEDGQGEGDDEAPADWEAAGEEDGDGEVEDATEDTSAEKDGASPSDGKDEMDVGEVARQASEKAQRRRIWLATARLAREAASVECPEEDLVKIALLHALLAHHLSLPTRLLRLPSSRTLAKGPLDPKPTNPRTFFELFAAHVVRRVETAGGGDLSLVGHVVDGPLFHRTLALAHALGGIPSEEALGLPADVKATFASMWKAFITVVGSDIAPKSDLFPLLGKDSGVLAKALQNLSTAREGGEEPQESKSLVVSCTRMLSPVTSPLVDNLLTEEDKKTLATYVSSAAEKKDGNDAKKKKKKACYWLPPDPLEVDDDEDEELTPAQRAALARKERKEKAKAERGRGVALDEKENAKDKKADGLKASGKDGPSKEEIQLKKNQLLLTFMTKYAMSLSGTKLVLRDVIVAQSSQEKTGGKGSGGWQGTAGGKKGGWNKGGKKKGKGKQSGQGQARIEMIKAGVVAKNREQIANDVVSYVAAARRIPIAAAISAEERKRKEEERLGVSFAAATPSEETTATSSGPVSRISLTALESRISTLDERLVDIADPNVVPGLLVLLDWCVLSWCEHRCPDASFELPILIKGEEDDQDQDGEKDDDDEEEKDEGSPTDAEMARAVRVFHVAYDIFRRFKQELKPLEMAKVLHALLVLGFEQQAAKMMQEYATVKRLKLPKKAPAFAAGDPLAEQDDHLKMALDLLAQLKLQLKRPKGEGLEDEEDDYDEDEDDEDEDDGRRGGRTEKERKEAARRARAAKNEAARRYRQLAVQGHRVNMSPERFQLTYGGPKMVRDVQSAPDARCSFYPDAWQREMLDVVDRRGSALIVAPTSSGKTFASYYAMKKILTYNKQTKVKVTGLLSGPLMIVYVCPTKALVRQVAAGVYRRYGAVFGVLTPGEKYRTANCEVLVTLPECLEEIMLSPHCEAWVSRVKYVIYDEVHSLDGEGGGPWERLLLGFPAPFLALSATVGNPTAFHSWLCKARARTSAVPQLTDPDAKDETKKPEASASKKGGKKGKKGGKKGKQRGAQDGDEDEESLANPFPNDNAEVALIVHKKRWADLEKVVYLPTAHRDKLLVSYKHGISAPKTKAERAELKRQGRTLPKLLPSGLLPFHPVAAIAFGAVRTDRQQESSSSSSSFSAVGSSITVPSSMEFSPRDSIVLYDHMSQLAEKVKQRSSELKQLEPSAHFRGTTYIGRDAAADYGEKVKATFGVWAAKATADGKDRARGVLEQLATPIRQGLQAVSRRGEQWSSQKFVMRYVLPLLVDLNREDKLPCVAFSLDPNFCEALAIRILNTLERLERAADEREGGAAEKRRQANIARRAKKLVKRMRNRNKGNSMAGPSPAATGASGKKLTHDEIARANAAREERRRQDEELRLAAAKMDQDEIDELMDVDVRFSFVSDTERPSREDLEYWLTRLRKNTGWPVDHPLIKALWRGVGVHHEGLPRSYKDLVETMFRARQVKVVIATGTLAVGVNMPSRTTVFLGDSPRLTPLAFRQMAGRAGRRGHDDVGYVAFLGVPMQKIAALMTSPLTSLRGRYMVGESLALRMSIFHANAADPPRATALLKNILTSPPLEHANPDLATRQARVTYRFSLEHLQQLSVIDSQAKPVSLAGIPALLHREGPAGFALASMIRSGILRRVCGGPSRFKANPDGCARRLMFVLCHLFLRVPLPPNTSRARYKRSSSTVVLAPLPPRLSNFLRSFDLQALNFTMQGLSAFAMTLKDSPQGGTSKGQEAKELTPAEPKKNIKPKKLSKKERKRLEALKRLRQNNQQPKPQPKKAPDVACSPGVSAPVPYGSLPLSLVSSNPTKPVDLPKPPSPESMMGMIGEPEDEPVRSEFASSGSHGPVFASAGEVLDSSRLELTVHTKMLPVLGGGAGSEPETYMSGPSDEQNENDDLMAAWNGPQLNAYALDFLKHGQLGTIVHDNRVSAGRAWSLLFKWDLLLTSLASAVTKMQRSPDYAPTFSHLSKRFRLKFRALSEQG